MIINSIIILDFFFPPPLVFLFSPRTSAIIVFSISRSYITLCCVCITKPFNARTLERNWLFRVSVRYPALKPVQYRGKKTKEKKKPYNLKNPKRFQLIHDRVSIPWTYTRTHKYPLTISAARWYVFIIVPSPERSFRTLRTHYTLCSIGICTLIHQDTLVESVG